MPKGKQLAFNRGEVSPAFRYKSSSITYQEGLHRLRNGFPRRGGGVSNRPGFRYIRPMPDTGIEQKGVQSNTKLFYVRRNVDKTASDYDIRYDNNEVYFLSKGSTTQLDGFILKPDFTQYRFADQYSNTVISDVTRMSWANFENRGLFFSFGEGVSLRYGDPINFRDTGYTGIANGLYLISQKVVNDLFHTSRTETPGLLVTIRPTSDDPNPEIRGAYIITRELPNGSEEFVCAYEGSFNSYAGLAVTFRLFSDDVGAADGSVIRNALVRRRGTGVLILGSEQYAFPSDIDHDTGRLRADLTLNGRIQGDEVAYTTVEPQLINPTIPGVTHKYNLYKSTSLRSPFALVASNVGRPGDKVELVDGGGSVTSRGVRDSFRLFGGLSDQPSFNNTLLNFRHVDTASYVRGSDRGSGSHHLYAPYVADPATMPVVFNRQIVPFHNISRVMRYQQRTFATYTKVGPTDDEQKSLKVVIGVSKINTDYDFATGQVVNPVDAFEFNVPINDTSDVVAMLPAERPLIFTENNVFMLLGTDAGIITPTEINPITIYTGGCSPNVQPVLVDNQAFFLNNDHTSLVMIDFNKSGGRGVTLIETDAYAKHFLEKSITQIAVVKSFETVIWLLREDGSLLSMTMYEEGVFGFGLHELTDGYVENITAARYPYIYQENYKDIGNEKGWNVPDVEVLAATIVRDGNRSLEVMTGRDDRIPENMGFADGFKTFGMRLSRRSPDAYYTDLEREDYRFDTIYRVPTLKFAEDFNAVYTAFKIVLARVSWVQQFLDQGSSVLQTRDDLGYTDTGETLIKSRDTAQDRAYTSAITFSRDTERWGVYDVLFNGNFSFYSLLPPPILTASGEKLKELFYIYATLIQDFVTAGAETIEGVTHTRFDLLTFDQQQLFLRMVRDGGVVNMETPEELVYYYKEKRHKFVKYHDSDITTLVNGRYPNLDDGVLTPAHVESGRSTRTDLFIDGATQIKTPDGGTGRLRPVGEGDFTMFLPNPITTVEDSTVFATLTTEYYTRDDLPDEALGASNLEQRSNWSPLTKRITGLDHLAGKEVSVFADNEVVSSPLTNNERKKQSTLTVDAEGNLELPEYYEWGIVGLPYRFEMESLHIEAQDPRTFIGGQILINRLGVAFHNTREGAELGSINGIEYNPKSDKSFTTFSEDIDGISKVLNPETGTFSGIVEPHLSSGWSEGGRVRITNADPTPITVNAIYPKGIESGD